MKLWCQQKQKEATFDMEKSPPLLGKTRKMDGRRGVSYKWRALPPLATGQYQKPLSGNAVTTPQDESLGLLTPRGKTGTFLFHALHVHELLHVVGVVQPHLHADKGLPALQAQLVPGLGPRQQVRDRALRQP